MGFILDGLEAEDYDRDYGDRVLVRRIAGYFRPHWLKMLVVGAMVALAALVETIIPIAIARGIDLLAGNPTLQIILALTGLITVLSSLGWFFNYLRQYLTAQAVGAVVLKLREDAFGAVMQHDLSFYDQYASGRIVSRVTSDTQDFASVVTLTIELIGQLTLVLVIGAVLFVINWQLALIAFAVAPLVFAAALAFRRIARWTTQRAQRATAEVNTTIQETINGIAIAKSFRREAALYADFDTMNRVAYNVRMQRGLVLVSIFPILELLGALGTAAVVYFGGVRVLDGEISAGDWYLFVQSLAIFLFPLTSVASFWSQFQQGLAASERVFALIDAEPRVVQTAAEPVNELAGRITFAQVQFRYGSAVAGTGAQPDWVLPDFSLDIPAGQKLAVVGHTGAGKSSLIRLITRFYEFQGGRICIDGRDIRRLKLSDYRRRIGLVPQVPFLFSGTVADNIRYGRPDASDGDVERAAALIGGGEWLADLPAGLQTDVGERGAQLSLGQRQLVALARVLLQDPQIFILDEATANIDPFTEEQIQAGLDELMRGRTSIIIAHRLSTVRNADRIIVLKQGRIIEEGDHAGLMLQAGHYAELYNTYFRHQSLAYIEAVGKFV